MYRTKTFTVKEEPYLIVEMSTNSGSDHINVKFLKHDTNECFSIQVPDMNRFNPNKWDFIYIDDKKLDDHYEYFVFTAGRGIVDRIVIIDLINKKFSVSKIIDLFKVENIVLNIMDIDPTIIGIRVEYYDHDLKFSELYVEEYIEDLMFAFYSSPKKYEEIPDSSVKYLDENSEPISNNGFKNPSKDLDHNKIRKEDKIMPTKKNETKATTTATEVTTDADKKELTPREIISEYAEAYDDMTKDAIRGNEVFGLLAPEHRLAIAAHLDQIVEILENYIK